MFQDQWAACVGLLGDQLPERDMNTYVRPLRADGDDSQVILFAPNAVVAQYIKSHLMPDIDRAVKRCFENNNINISISIGHPSIQSGSKTPNGKEKKVKTPWKSPIDSSYCFENFVKGKSNQFAAAATQRVAEQPGSSYNPLLIVGGVGLGKTHLIHAVANRIKDKNKKANIVYVNAEQWVNRMVNALRHNRMTEFKEYYRSVDALLIDDIQFFADKKGSQEEFFHTFNALREGEQQIILTCDRYPREVEGIEERLKSRFAGGLTVAIEPPDLETRVAILMAKAEQKGTRIPEDVAFLIAQRIKNNVREVESALFSLIAQEEITGEPISIEIARDVLHDMFSAHHRHVTVELIQRTVADYFHIKHADLLSTKRARSVARPRQFAMALSRELTEHSLPEIAESFAKKDHTTVLHACKTIAALKSTDNRVADDYRNLYRTLSQ